MALLPPPHSPPPRNSSFPSLPHRRQRKGRGGGAGLPSVLRLHRVFRLNQEIFLLPKRKKKKKKNPAATFPPCPIGTVETGSVGFPGRVAQGWNTLRQEWWSSRSGPPPGPLRAYLPLLPSSPPSNHQRWPSPALQPLGGTPPLPAELGTPLQELLWGHSLPSSSLCHLHPPGRRARPQAGRGEGAAGRAGPSAPCWHSPFWESLCVQAQPLTPLLPVLPVIGINPGTSLSRTTLISASPSADAVALLSGDTAQGLPWVGRQGHGVGTGWAK